MISFDFDYYKPASAAEAVQRFRDLDAQGLQPLYYSGGTEIITFARMNHISTQAVIDIKAIPECLVLHKEDNRLVIGSALTLTRLIEANPFPLLSASSEEIADHTARTKITIGGNLCGKIIFREAALPFLLADSEVVTIGTNGWRRNPINEMFTGELRLQRGEMLVQLLTDADILGLPYVSIKKRRIGKTGYPLVTVASLKKDNRLRFAFSGVCSFPFRSRQMEDDLNDSRLSPEQRIRQAMEHLPGPILNNTEGSADYRAFILQKTIMDIFRKLGGVSI